MPLVQIDLDRSLAERLWEQLSIGFHQALVESLGCPPDDKFQIFRAHEPGELVFDPG